LEFIKSKNYIKERLDKIPRYNTLREKEALLIFEDSSLIEIFNVLCPDSKVIPDNEIEAGAFILKSREESVSDLIEGFHECSCGVINDFSVEIESLFNFEIKSNIPIGLFEKVEDIINNTDVLTVKEYNILLDEIIENNNKILSITIDTKCRSCGKSIKSSLNPSNYISRSSIAGIYDEYFTLSFYTNLTKKDIDEMYPFEREIFIGLLKKKLEQNPQSTLK